MRQIVLVLFLAVPIIAQENNIKLTAADKAKVVKLTHALEADPLARDARESRRWLVDKLTQTNDPNVIVCPAIFGDLLSDKDFKYQSELIAQPIFGQGAYLIEHADAKDDDLATFVAGLNSLLLSYERFAAKDAKSKRAYLDALVTARNKNELPAWVEEHLKECRK
jgi:hypothetical protein